MKQPNPRRSTLGGVLSVLVTQPTTQPRVDPQSVLASAETLRRIEEACRRNFSDENASIQCCNFIIDRLKADDFKRLRAFQGKSSLNTYIYATVNRLVVDFRREQYGRRRVPAAVQRLGKWADRVYRLTCWQKFSFDDAYDLIVVEGLFSGSYPDYIRRAAPILEAPCREAPTFQSTDTTGVNPVQASTDPASNPLEELIARLDHERRRTALRVIRDTLAKLTEDDRLLVDLVYGSGRSVAAAGRVVGLRGPSAARRRMKSIHTAFRKALLAKGIREP